VSEIEWNKKIPGSVVYVPKFVCSAIAASSIDHEVESRQRLSLKNEIKIYFRLFKTTAAKVLAAFLNKTNCTNSKKRFRFLEKTDPVFWKKRIRFFGKNGRTVPAFF
jgi:hypothetical protein